jgi:hypothetical protein
MVVYTTWGLYINSKTTARERIAAIEAIIDVLMTTALGAAGNEDITEYYLDSGQTKVTMKYRGSEQVIKAIQGFETLKQLYISRVNGRQIRQIPEQNFRYRR